MYFIKHSINWCKGEIFEGRMIFLFGIIFLIITFSFWKYGTTPSAKALIIPIFILSVLSIGTGLSMNFSNQKNIVSFEKAYNENARNFVKKEKERTEAFIKWYPFTRYVGAGLILTGLLLFLFTILPLWKSISLCLIVLAFAVLVIDYFSEERANQYHYQILNYYQQ